jgi:hypothetical protein
VGEQRKLDGVQAAGLTADGEGPDDPVADTQAFGDRAALVIALGLSGQATGGDCGVGGVHDDSGDRPCRCQRGTDAVDQADEQALATVRRLDGTPQGVLQQAHRVSPRHEAP